MGSLLHLVMRAPKLVLVLVLLLLTVLAGISTYAGYQVIGMISVYMGTGRFTAALLLGVLFARLPRVRNGKLSTIGLLPKIARLPVMFLLLGSSLLHYGVQGDVMPALFIGLAMALLLLYRWMRQAVVTRIRAAFFNARPDTTRPAGNDPTVIDVDFREKKD